MNTDTFAGYWHEIKGKVKEKWGNFTDDEVTQMEGTYEGLKGAVQRKYGYAKEQAQKEVDEFLKTHQWDK